jgi:DNA-binding NarL/FixJ family response regulator
VSGAEGQAPLVLLHLEDNSADALLVRRQLERELPGILVRAVSAESEFQRTLAEERIHVVLSDLSLPGYHGLTALRYARTHYPLIPFIIYSSNDDPKVVRSALRYGASDYLFKSELQDLPRAIAGAASRRDGDVRGLERRLESRARAFELSAELLRERDFSRALRRVLEVAVSLLKADKGNVLLFEEAKNQLRLADSIGFPQDFLDRYGSLPANSPTACGRAFQRRERVVVEDIHRDPDFSKLGSQTESYGFAAVQSTPLRGRDGRLFGILSTHTERPGRPPEEGLRTLDLYIQEAERVFQLLGSPK